MCIQKGYFSNEDRRGDKFIASVLNKIEDLSINKFDEKKLKGLVSTLNLFHSQDFYPRRMKFHKEEIKGVVEGVFEYYKNNEKDVPDIGFLYN